MPFNGRDPRVSDTAVAATQPPPLPPKHTKQDGGGHPPLPPPNVDWFSNPLFDQRGGGASSSTTRAPASAGVVGGRRGSKPSTPLRFTYDLDSFSDLPSPHGLDTTLPDTTSFPYADDSVTSPNDYSCATTTTGTTPEQLLPPSGVGVLGLDESDYSCEPSVHNHPYPQELNSDVRKTQGPPPPLTINSYGSNSTSAR